VNVKLAGGSAFAPARLYSVTFPQASSTCQIKFWRYSIYGYGLLNVSMYIDNQKKATLFKLDQDSTTAWKQNIIDLGI
jgi:hypothetical protein